MVWYNIDKPTKTIMEHQDSCWWAKDRDKNPKSGYWTSKKPDMSKFRGYKSYPCEHCE